MLGHERCALVVLSSLALLLSGCDRILAAMQQEIEERVRQQVLDGYRAGSGNDDKEQEQPPSTIQVNSVMPGRGETTGGLLVQIIGRHFVSGMRVYFGDVPVDAAHTDVLDENRIQVFTPPAVGPGFVDVAVATPDNLSGLLAQGFEYYEPVSLASVAPARGPSIGGTPVVLQGAGFVEGTAVRFGSTDPVLAVLVDDTQATVNTPPLPRGAHDVTIFNANGQAAIADAFTTYDLLRVTGVEPFAGPLTGGTPVVVRGSGFLQPATLTLGGRELVAVGNTDEDELAATTLPPTPLAEGAVDVLVENELGGASAPLAFLFYDSNNPDPRVSAVMPATGLIEGGSEVRIAGAGFAAAGTTVTFGDVEAECLVLDDHMVSCTLPAVDAEGSVDVHVVNAGMDELLALGFTYIELRLDNLLPSTGALAGGTYLELYGNGFGPDTVVEIGGMRARDISVESWGKITLRSPRGALGSASMRILTQGVEKTIADAFAYYQPYRSGHWSWGGRVDGELNITAITDTGRLAGAFMMLGTDPSTPYQGFTDDAGQITFSGPDVQGPLTVTGGKPDHSLFSWVEVDARNLTMTMYPPPESGGGSGGGGGGDTLAPPVVRGTVYRIKDEYNYGDDLVVVTTTQLSLGMGGPQAGPLAELVNQGPYELRARDADMIVVALAGRMINNRFKVHALGFHPFIFTEYGSGEGCVTSDECPTGEQCYDFDGTFACTKIYDGVDITIDTPLKQPLRIELDDPPLPDPADVSPSPDTASARVWYDFGYLGVLPMGRVTVPGSDRVVLIDMPRRLPEALSGTPFYAEVGVYLGFDGDGNPDTPPSLSTPESEVYLPGLLDTTETVVATPFLGTQSCLEPLMTTEDPFPLVRGDPMIFAFTVNRDPLPSANLHYFYVVEETSRLGAIVLTPGNHRTFELPVFPGAGASSGLPTNSEEGYYYWQLLALYSEGARFNELQRDELFDWRSEAVANSRFRIGAPPASP